MGAKIIAYTLIGILLGPLLSLVATPILSLLGKLFIVPFLRKKMREDAIKNGHVIEATLKKKYDVMKQDPEIGLIGTAYETGVYIYQHNGKKYRYQTISTRTPSPTITLYYIKNPRKATVANDLGNHETPWLRLYLITSLVITISTVVVGLAIG